MNKNRQQKIKQQQANMQSDALEMDSWVPSSEGITMTGTVDSLDPGVDVSYSWGDVDFQTADMFEENLRKKYPALQDAFDHYQSVKKMCETREKEEDEN